MKVIDIHIHGGFGICFDTASSGQINDFAKQAFEKGVAAFCPALTGGTPEETRRKLENIKAAKAAQGKNEALIIGANLEGAFLNRARPGVQNPDIFLMPNVQNFKKITEGFEDIVKIVVIAPETNDCTGLIKYLKSKDIKVHYGHTLTRTIDGADGICHLFNAMEPITHKHETAAIKALLNKEIYTEIIADMVHISRDILELTFKVRPKNRIILISDALPVAGSNLDWVQFCGKKIFKNGLDEKGTLGGSIRLLPDIVQNLCAERVLTEETAKRLAYDNPRDYLKLIV